jgi:protein SCO1/2
MTNSHNPSQTISTQKIIAFLVFICAALMASLFIYHSNQKPERPIISPDIGIIFPLPRDIKSFELMSTEQKKFTEKDFYHHWTLLFFGFTHCASICPSSLDVMNRVYTKLHDKYPNLNVVFVSVDPERDNLAKLTSYTQQYNPAFLGLTGKIQAIRKLQSQVGVYSGLDNSLNSVANTATDSAANNSAGTNSAAPNSLGAHASVLNSAAAKNYQIQHTASIMLIDPQGKWAGLFKFGIKPDELANGFETAANLSWRSHG